MQRSPSSAEGGLRPPGLGLLLAEARGLLEFNASIALAPLLVNARKGDGHPVLFLPGFMTSDVFTAPLQNRVAERGFKVYGWENGFNMGFDEKTAEHLKKRLKEKSFAANVSREDIQDACERAGIVQDDLIQFIIPRQATVAAV